MIRVAYAVAVAFLVTLAGVALGAGGGPRDARAAAAPSSGAGAPTIEASFSPNRPGARTATSFSVHFPDGPEGVPESVRKEVVLLPAGLSGLSLEWPTTAGCSRATLLRRGASGCPARSQVGSGSELLAWREGSSTVTEHVRLWEFEGPDNGEFKFEILGEGTSPIRRREVATVSLAALSGIYSASQESVMPLIPTRPGEPDASVVSFSITTGNAKRPRFSGRGVYGGLGLFVPSPCPAGGYPWSDEFTFANGATQKVTATTPCT